MAFALSVAVGLLIVGNLISAGVLWLSVRVVGIKPASFRRAFVINLGLILPGALLWFLQFRLPNYLPVSLGLFFAGLGILYTAIRVGFRAKPGRSANALVILCILSTATTVGLIFGIRGFIAEAFVIPTGGMADSVLGYHKDVACPECGFPFHVNSASEDPVADWVDPVRGCTCPNCRTAVKFVVPDDRPDATAVPSPPNERGDRILVDKTGVTPRGRFAVVVFDYPGSPGQPRPPAPTLLADFLDFLTGLYGQPASTQTRQAAPTRIRYIKRLIGLPGETIAIHAGKLYATDALFKDAPPPTDASVDASLLAMRANDPEAVKLFEEGLAHPSDASGFHMLSKPPELVLALRHPVFDNDYQPKDRAEHPTRWGGAGWQAEDGASPKTFVHAGGDLAWLRYRHLVGGKEQPLPEIVTDFIGYNTGSRLRSDAGHWVGDLLLEFDVEVTQAGDGDELVVELSKGVDRFRARFQLTTGEYALTRTTDGKEESLPLSATATTLKGVGKHSVRFANVDQRLLLWIDGKLVSEEGVVYPPAKIEGPTDNDLEPASVGVKGAVKIGGLKLWRDTFNTCAGRFADSAGEEISSDLRVQPSRWRQGGRPLPVMTLFAPPGHTLCFGDNSPQSSDSRFWGPVADRLMVGPVSIVYWPWARAGQVR